MAKKKAHSTTTIPENSITQEQLVALVENLCQNSINGPIDVRPRLHGVFEQYHAAIAGKVFLYDANMPALDFSQIDTTVIENKIGHILLTNLVGRIAESLDLTRSLWNDGILTNVCIIIPDQQDYYRTRTSDKPLISAREMFHTPFELRGLVKTARFSILGFPSLYLTKNMFTSWEETRRSDIETLYASRLRLQRPIALVDLRLRRTFGEVKQEEREAAARQYLYTIPLIIACSLKVQRDTDSFKPEYILPQLILHAIIDEMIRRYRLRRPKGYKFLDSTLEIADELTDQLLRFYQGNKVKMQEEVSQWDDSCGKEWSKEKVASRLLRSFLLTKYYEEQTKDGKLILPDADWTHYECNKSIRKFSEASLDGIIYSSTRFDHNYWSQKEDVNSDCIVLPVHSIRPHGFCEYLLHTFTITPPVGFKPAYLKTINNKGSEKKEYQHSYFGLIEQELQKQKLQKLNNFYGTPIQREKEEWLKLFEEQVQTINQLCELYDKGTPYNASLIAITLRNILGRRNLQHSLWELKNGHDCLFCDSAADRIKGPQNYTVKPSYDAQGRLILPNVVITGTEKVYDGFLRKVISQEGEYNLYPLLDERKEKVKWKTFEEWINQVIFAVNDVTFTRKQAIEIVAGYEGNLSGALPDNYALFRTPTALQILVNGRPVRFNQNPVFVSIRQIAWEIIVTLNKYDNTTIKQL